MQPNKRAKQLLIYGAGQSFSLLSPFLVTPYLMHICGESGFGKVGMGFSLALFLTLIVDYSFDIKGVKEIAEHRDDESYLARAFKRIMAAKAVLLIIALLTGTAIVNLIPALRAESTTMYFGFSIMIGQFLNPSWYLQGKDKFKTVSVILALSRLGYVALVFLIVTKKSDYPMINLCFGISSCVVNGIMIGWLILRKSLLKAAISKNEVVSLLRVDFFFCVSQLFVSARQQAPILLVGTFLGFQSAGLYRVVEQVTMLFRTFLQVFNRFFYPELCYRTSSSAVEGYVFWRKYTILALIIVVFGVIGIFVVADDVLPDFFNIAGNRAHMLSGLIRLAMLLPLVLVFSFGFEQMLFANGKNNVYTKTVFILTAASLLVMTICTLFGGVTGTVLALIVTEISFVAGYGYAMKGIVKKSDIWF